jgi:uncharacterized protein (TIGR00369 family)
VTQPVLDPAIAARLRASLESQGLFRHLGAGVEAIDHGAAALTLPFRREVSQGYGFFHGGVIGFLIDNASTCAASTVMRPGEAVLTAEYKLNILAPATGGELVCRASVIKPGRMLIPVDARVFHRQPDGGEKLVAVGLVTVAVVPAERVGR